MTGSGGKVTLLLLLTFAAGAAAGVAADRLNLLPETARAEETAGTEEERTDDRKRPRTTIERFADELGLTAEQRSRIEEILSAFRGEVKELRKDFHPRWEALVDSTRARIEAVLTPEQVEQYRTLLKRERAERRGDGKDEGEESEADARRGEAGRGGPPPPAAGGTRP